MSILGYAERDILALGIATAAIIMFVGTGGTVVPQVIRSLAGYGIGPDKALLNALLLNIALIIFGWRRYRQLSAEVEERRRAEEHARLLAETDPLTGYLNRRSFADELNRLITESQAKVLGVVVMMIDLDNFKQVNDYNGHGAGDEMLQRTASRIASTMPDHTLKARIGGDEFACALEFDKSRPELIDELASTVIDDISRPVRVNGISLEVTASLGIAQSDIGSGPNDAQTLLEMSDIAMYHAKRQGRNCYYWFEESMADEMRYRIEVENGIRAGVPAGEFVPYYEQQIDLQTGELTGFEMLARWNSPKFGLVGPDIFIPIAEDIGAISELSECVIAQALEDAKSWDQDLTLAVNISPLQLRDPWFAQKLLKLLLNANFPPQRLEIEITESCLHENIANVRTLLSSLQNQGVRVSLDDFGTGYSSLAQLRSLPFDRIKIDRTFVSDLVENKDSAAIVHAIAMLGKGLGLPITAEGIETAGVLDQLRQYGQIKGQGYLYGKPRSASDTQEMLEGRDRLETGFAIAEEALGEVNDMPDPAIVPRRAGNA